MFRVILEVSWTAWFLLDCRWDLMRDASVGNFWPFRAMLDSVRRYFSNVCGLWPSSTLDAIHVDTYAV